MRRAPTVTDGIGGRGRAARFRLLGVLAAAALAGCSAGLDRGGTGSAAGDFARAQAEFDRGHHAEAIALLENFERGHPGSQYIDDAVFLLGRAHQGNGEQILARAAFERLREDFPQSPFAEEALFQIGRSWFLSVRGPALDPEPAEEALRVFGIYMRRYPEGAFVEEARKGEQGALGVLAEKERLNGVTYLRLGRYEAARRCFERSLERWPEAPRSAEALAGIARAREREGDASGARNAWQRLLEHLGEDPARYRKGKELAREAGKRLARLDADGS